MNEWLISYDVSVVSLEGRRRLRRVAKLCEGHGQRVQYSVFECRLSDAQFIVLWEKLTSAIHEVEDTIRAYRLAEPRDRFIRTAGKGVAFDLRGPLVV